VACKRANRGVSSRRARMTKPTAISTPLRKNGTRQPQDWKSSFERVPWNRAMAPVAASRPSGTPTWRQLARQPRRPRWPYSSAGRERQKGEDLGPEIVEFGEVELWKDQGGGGPVEEEVVPLDGRPNGAGDHGLDQRAGAGLGLDVGRGRYVGHGPISVRGGLEL